MSDTKFLFSNKNKIINLTESQRRTMGLQPLRFWSVVIRPQKKCTVMIEAQDRNHSRNGEKRLGLARISPLNKNLGIVLQVHSLECVVACRVWDSGSETRSFARADCPVLDSEWGGKSGKDWKKKFWEEGKVLGSGENGWGEFREEWGMKDWRWSCWQSWRWRGWVGLVGRERSGRGWFWCTTKVFGWCWCGGFP